MNNQNTTLGVNHPEIGAGDAEIKALMAAQTQPPTLPSPVRVARGKGFVNVQHFASTGSANDNKAAIKVANPKISSKELHNRVNAVLRGETPLRDQLTVAWVQACIQDGYTGNYGERGHKTACLRMVKVQPEPAPAPEVKDDPKSKEAIEAKIAELTKALESLKK